MDIEFYFDPSCPFCWITSRWLLMVASERGVRIDWRPFSLAMKNDELDDNKPDKTEHGDIHRGSTRVLRVMLAAQELYGASLIDLYTAFGKAFHLDKREFDDDLIRDILVQFDLSTDLIEAADNIKYDNELSRSLDGATSVAGQDIGVPTIIFINDDGSKSGYFGPVLQELPSKSDGLKLWDGLSLLASNKDFYELKRTRPSGEPNVGSTANT